MNTGLVSKRYAKALMTLAQQNGTLETVQADVVRLRDALQEEMAHEGDDQILCHCVPTLCEEVQRFLCVVTQNHRADLLPFMLHSFIVQYNQSQGITTASLITATPAPGLEDKLLTLLHERGFTKVDFTTSVDPALAGGFILQVEDKRLDASLATQLETIRRTFEEKNRSLV